MHRIGEDENQANYLNQLFPIEYSNHHHRLPNLSGYQKTTAVQFFLCSCYSIVERSLAVYNRGLPPQAGGDSARGLKGYTNRVNFVSLSP